MVFIRVVIKPGEGGAIKSNRDSSRMDSVVLSMNLDWLIESHELPPVLVVWVPLQLIQNTIAAQETRFSRGTAFRAESRHLIP